MADDPITVRIDLGSPVPAYRQIANALRGVLVRGGVKPGSRLPTIRELAMDLGVHPNTVAQAYRILAEEGWLELRRRRGATVLERRTPPAGDETRERWARRLEELVAEALALGVSRGDVAARLRRAAESVLEEADDGERSVS